MTRWIAIVALTALAMAAGAGCSSDQDDSAPDATTLAGAWGSCTTRLDFDRVVLDVADPDPAVRDEALATVEAMPLPMGLEQGWTTLVAILKRYVDLAARVQESDPAAFRAAVDQLAEQDAGMTSLNGLTNEDEQQHIGALRYASPCDATGLSEDFGCGEPQACTQEWIDAVRGGDEASLDLLGSPWLRPADGAVPPDVELGSCADAADRPGVQRCSFTGGDIRGSVDWYTTTDGRWYGLDSRVTTAVPTATTTVP